MTVVESPASSSFGGGPVVSNGGIHSQQHGGGQPQANMNGLSISREPNPMALKAREEILTSRHLIKDIRRLETYQRDFFLKVKESLNHVQLLLDHQLMDMAWSDTLIDCEESLLQASVHLGHSTPSQVSELYAILLQDREKLNHRFQELSVKSSLSEYVVNSRTLLDVETVHLATEAILRNEKPVQPKPDKIPVDHTFFLANFCTTSIASSMFASFMPKRDSYRGFDNIPSSASCMGSGASKASNATITTISSHHHNNVGTNLADKTAGMKSSMIGSQLQQPPQAFSQQQQVDKYYGSPGDLSSMAGINNGLCNSEVMDKYMRHSHSAGNGATSNLQDSDLLKNVFTGHELVAAISQITCRDDTSPNKGKKPQTDLWGTNEDPNLLLGPQEESVLHRTNGSHGSSYVGQSAFSTMPSEHQQLRVTRHDASSESITSESDDGRSNGHSSAAATYVDFESKPLSFARIASLNIEKNAMVSRPSAMPNNSILSSSKAVANINMTILPPSLPLPSGPSLSGTVSSAGINVPPPTSTAANLVSQASAIASVPLINLPPTTNPRYFFDIAMEGKRLGRVVIEVQPSVAPKMSHNFGMLVIGERGFGYKGCQFFQAWKNESVICGDWEHNSGRGGRAALEGGPLFTPDETRLPCVRGAVGMRRMSKKHSSLNQVASQFRIILANMNTQFTGIFGHVIYGIEALDKVANIGGEGGRPEKSAAVIACGIYKS